MSSELKASVKLDMSGNLQTQARRSTAAMERMSQRGQRHMRLLSGSMRMVGNGLDRLGNRYTAFLTGGGLALAARGVANLNAQFTRLKTDGRATAEQIAALKQRLFEVANDPSVRVSPDAILGAFGEIITRTGDFDFAFENLKNIGVAIQGIGAAGNDVGAIFSNFYKGGVRGANDVLAMTDAFAAAAKEGSVAAREVASVGNALYAPYLAAGKAGKQAFMDMNAVSQVTIDAVKSADEVGTATTALLAQLKDKKIQDQLAALTQGKLKVVDKNGLRDLPALISEIANAAGRDVSKLGMVFNESAIKVFEGALLPGNMEKMQRLANMTADGSEILGDAAENARTFNSALTSLNTTVQKFSNSELGGAVSTLADGFNSLEPGTVDRWMQMAKWGAGGLGGLILARKGLGSYRWVRNALGGGKGIGGALGAAAGASGVTPVYVVNLPGAGMPGMDIPGKGTRGVAGGMAARGRRFLTGAKSLRVLAGGLPLSAWGSMGAAGIGTAGAGVLAAGGAGYAVGTGINKAAESLARGTRFEGVGTEYIGGAIAKALALIGVEEARRAVEINERARQEAKAELKLSLDIDDRRATVKSARMQGMDVDIDSGLYMAGP